jgi:hypothetical protein
MRHLNRHRPKIDDVIDEIVVGDGSDPARYITTSFHEDATVAEVLDFARMWERDLGSMQRSSGSSPST